MAGLVALMYHRVAPDSSGPLAHLTVSPERFAWQMMTLRDSGFRALRQDEVVGWLRGQRDLPARSVVITFDDAYADNVAHAFPVLERLRIPAVTFVVTGKLGGRNDWDETARWSLMDGAAVKDWAARGFEFGGHGRTHRDLTRLDVAALIEDIEGCKDDLARLLGAAPLAFAYPYGQVDGRVRERVQDCFALAYGTQTGRNRRTDDPLQLRRTAVLPAYPDYEFLSQLRLGWGPRDRTHRAFARLRHWIGAE